MPDMSNLVGAIPYRMAFAGGWIDQPFVSERNPSPPGSMVVVSLEPIYPFMEGAGMGTSTRRAAAKLWGGRLPEGDSARLVRELYEAENRDKPEPSGSQDMAGLVYPGVSRLDYDHDFEDGYFPKHVECNTSVTIARWLEGMIHMLPVCPRPEGYSPLGVKNLDREWIGRLGQSGKDCFEAILHKDVQALGASMNECMKCWEAILPQTVRHPALSADLIRILEHYQARYPGAMYSGCGGGYLYIVSAEKVPGTVGVRVRTGGPRTG